MNDRPSSMSAPVVIGITVIVIALMAFFAVQQRPSELAAVGEAASQDAGQEDKAEVEDKVEAVPVEAETTSDGAESDAVSEPASETATITNSATVTEDTTITETVVLTETATGTETASSEAETTTADTQTETETVAAQTVSAPPQASEELVTLFATGGCMACHVIPGVPGANGPLGPNLSNIGVGAATRIEGYSAEQYIRESLLEPNAFIAPTCPNGDCPADLMLPIFGELFTESQIDTIVGYLLTLQGGEQSDVAIAEPEEVAAAEEAPADETVAEATIDMDAVAAAVTKGTCGACHVVPGVAGAMGALGPDLTNIGAEAATRIAGYTTEEYLLESLLEPNAFIAPTCPTGDCLPGLMLPNLAEMLTEEEIDTIVGYLAMLDGE